MGPYKNCVYPLYVVYINCVLFQDQSIAMAQSEDEKRKEVADRFQSGINEIQDQLKDYLDKNNALRAENQMLAEKLQKFILEHEKREEHVEKVGRYRRFLPSKKWLFFFKKKVICCLKGDQDA